MPPSDVRVSRDEIVRQLAEAMDIHLCDSKACVKHLFDILRDHMMHGRTVVIPRFGSFRGQRVESRVTTVDGKTTVKKGVRARFESNRISFYG